jgi:hypothetical protein
MTEQRKYAILFAATLLSARRLIENIEKQQTKIERAIFCGRGDKESGVLFWNG